MTDNLPPQLYGIWVPHQGWWRLPAPDGGARAYAELRKDVAEHYARRIGKGASVEPIDMQLEMGNDYLLTIEKERIENNRWSKLWHTLKTFLHNRNT